VPRLYPVSFVAGGGLATSASSHALGECSPPISPITMSHTTPSIYPTSTSLGHNSYQTGTTNISPFMSSNPVTYNPTSQYNSLSHHTYTNKNMMGNAMTHHGIGSTLGQSSVLGGTLAHQNLTSSMGGNVMGTSLVSTGLGSSIVPPSYTTTAISNATFTNPLVSSNPSALQPTSYNNPTFTNSVTNTLNQFSLGYNPVTTTYSNNVTFSNPLSSQFNSLALTGPMSIKLKPLDEVDLGKLLTNSVKFISLYCHYKNRDF
jgi:hypothetical protein